MDTNITTGKRAKALWLLGFSLFLLHSVILAQEKPRFRLEDVTGNNDWNVRLKVSGGVASDMNCWGTDTYSYDIYKNGTKVGTSQGQLADNNVISVQNGVNEAASWYIVYKTNGSLFNCYYWKRSNSADAATGKLKPPVVAASDSSSEDAILNRIRVTWEKGTNAPNSVHHYWIYKDGDYSAPVAHIPGTDPYMWIDIDVHPGEKHTYSIITRISSSTSP